MPRTYKKKKEKKWTEEDVDSAINAVNSGQLSQYRAAKMYNIPTSTLNDRIREKVTKHGAGRPCRLSKEEEKEIVETCLIFGDWGYGIGKKEVLGVVGNYCKSNKIDVFPSGGVPKIEWWRGFLRRHPELSLRKPQALQISRAKAATPQIIDQWFSVLEPLINRLGLRNHPERIFNSDETSFCLCGRPQRVLAKKGAKSPQYTIGGTGKENITVQGCISATGKLLPPYILYTGQRLMFNYMQGGPIGARYGISTKGWMCENNFIDWFRNLFIPSLPEERPVLLILDGHESHVKYEVRQLAKDNQIEIAKMPSHTSHLLQPLDLGIFKPLKQAYDRSAHAFFLSERRYVTKRDFPALIGQAWKSYKPEYGINAFKKAGIVPLNRNAIANTSLAPSSSYQVTDYLPDSSITVDPLNSEGESRVEMLGTNVQDESAHCLNIRDSSLSPTVPTPTTPITSITHSISVTPVIGSTLPTISTPSPPVTPTSVTPIIGHALPNIPNPSPLATSPTIPTPSKPVTPLTTPSTQSSHNKSNELRDFFLDFFISKTPNRSNKGRNRCLASLGESLTEEDAIQKQKEYEDEKKRKEVEKEERKRIRIQKCEEKRKIEENKKRKLTEKGGRKSTRSKKRKVSEESAEICGICTGVWEDHTEETELWLACSLCGGWFHCSCVGLGDLVEEEVAEIDYICNLCKDE